MAFGYSPRKVTLTNLPQPLRQGAEQQWQRFVETISCGGLADSMGQALHLCQSRPELKTVWACSEFISHTCISDPALLIDLIESGDLDRQISPAIYRSMIGNRIGLCADEHTLHRKLRLMRRREMVRIAWRDLAGFSGLEETMSDLSALAEQAISLALEHHSRWLLARFGQPFGVNGEPASMVVLGLGKLGGSELNYSSDVDLIFAYDHPGRTRPKAGEDGIDNQVYFIKLGQKIIAALAQATADGFVFRTDMRLRPNGSNGPLVLSCPAMEHYYQTHGRDWERYALIKARQVAGDENAGQEILDILKPFVYRKYLDFGAFDSIRVMKGMIERELEQADFNQNIKLGWGGIREVEFLIQSHQLIRGGRENSLQTSRLYQAMTALKKLGVIDDEARTGLTTAYRFFRNTEHRLQMVQDKQTQMLPQTQMEQTRLAWSMGFDNWDRYIEKLDAHRNHVHDQFRMILDEEPDLPKGGSPGRDQLVDLWQGKLDGPQSREILTGLGFQSSNSTPRLLQGFREGRLYQAFSGIERDRIDRLIPLALREAGTHSDAERGMAAFVSVIEAIGRRSAYLSLLIENRIALKQLLHLCAASPWLSRHIGRHPVILDELLHPIMDIRNRDDRDLKSELDHRLVQIDLDDAEGRMVALREFQNAQLLRIAAADVSRVLSVTDVHRALVQLAEVLLNSVFGDAVRFVEGKQGAAPCSGGVIAYGKFASGEFGYHSDLDVVVCYDSSLADGSFSRSQAEYFYSRVGQRLVHLLMARTQAGLLYETDMRLRPSGRSGTLAVSLSGFFNYQINSAWTWEHQALVRARVVVGEKGLIDRFEQARTTILSMERDPDQLADDITGMRRKMINENCISTEQMYDIKLDEGGIVDIEFLIQYWILRHTHSCPNLAEPRTTADSIGALIAHGIIDASVGERLLTSYQTYLRHSLDLKLMDRPVLVEQGKLQVERQAVKVVWRQTFG